MGRAIQVDSLWNGILNTNGQPLSGGKVYTYDAGTSNPRTTWTDQSKTTPATNPIILDSNGQSLIYVDGAYKFVIKDSSDVTLYTRDNLLYLDLELQYNTPFTAINSGGSSVNLFKLNASNKFEFLLNDFLTPSGGFTLYPNTSDGTDNSYVQIGHTGSTRGAYVLCDGNEYSNPGWLELSCGNVTSGQILLRSFGTQPIALYTNSTSRFSIDGSSGNLVPSADNTYAIGDNTHELTSMSSRSFQCNGANLTVGTVGNFDVRIIANNIFRWIVKATGDLQPYADNAYAIGDNTHELTSLSTRICQCNGTDQTLGTVGNFDVRIIANNTYRWTFKAAGTFQPNADNTYDFGASGNHVKVGYFRTVAASGATLTVGTLTASSLNLATNNINRYSLDTSGNILPSGALSGSFGDSTHTLDKVWCRTVEAASGDDLTLTSDTGGLVFKTSGVQRGKFLTPDAHFRLENVAGAPSTPTGGGVLYVQAGALKYIGTSGTITTIAPA